LEASPGQARALVAVVAASHALARLCETQPLALPTLAALDRPVAVTARDLNELVQCKQLELLRIAARDLLGMDPLEEVGDRLATLADRVLDVALHLCGGPDTSGGHKLAVIAMGKLGAGELNYASDVDIMFVTGDTTGAAEAVTPLARRILQLARQCFRVDVDLRPEGRNGPLVRSLGAYRAYWERWATGWERQALLKARPVAGDEELGQAFARAAAEAVWAEPFGAEQIREARAMKARAEAQLARRGLTEREIKRGRGGIRDVEFSVQLLQLVHGRADPALRQPATLPALAELARAGYVSPGDATVLERAYRFLRAVEHRLQLVEEQPVHAVPATVVARNNLARVMGYRDSPAATALGQFDDDLRRHQAEARAVHERLFFRPLLEAFAILPGAGGGQPRAGAAGPMPESAVSERLAAFGFSDAARTRAALDELTRGLTRSSRLMAQTLALVLGWLSEEPDPDLGLLGLRTLADGSHRRALLVSTFRDSPEAARRLCRLLGTSRLLHELLRRDPEAIATLGDDTALVLGGRDELVERFRAGLRLRDPEDRSRGLFQLKQAQLLRIATRDLLGMDTIEVTAAALTSLTEAVLEAALELIDPPVAIAVVALGALAGAELSYTSDADLLLVSSGGPGASSEKVEAGAASLLRVLHGATPAERIMAIDPRLRPEGRHGRLAPTLDGYRSYFERRARTWERQALARARPVAGDQALAHGFMELADGFVWGQPWTAADLREVRRMKARLERERPPAPEDPQFHLKRGPGALADVEWTAQLLQLSRGIRSPSTRHALAALAKDGSLSGEEAGILAEAYQTCEQVRNRWALMGGRPPDALPVAGPQLARLAHSLETTPAELRERYRRVTRRARQVMEERFYGLGG
jgi:glutamate-ammonia-ligase adenylyltransferase